MKPGWWIAGFILAVVVGAFFYIVDIAGPIGQLNRVWNALLLGGVTWPVFVMYFYIAEKPARPSRVHSRNRR